MPMNRDEHEGLLTELLTTDLETSRRTEILQLLRTDYTSVINDFDEITKTSTKLKSENDDLIISNSKLFRQLGVVGAPESEKEKEKEKEYSETVTIESLEKGV